MNPLNDQLGADFMKPLSYSKCKRLKVENFIWQPLLLYFRAYLSGWVLKRQQLRQLYRVTQKDFAENKSCPELWNKLDIGNGHFWSTCACQRWLFPVPEKNPPQKSLFFRLSAKKMQCFLNWSENASRRELLLVVIACWSSKKNEEKGAWL